MGRTQTSLQTIFSENSQENEFLEAARSSETSDEFDALIFGAEQSDSVETTTTKNTNSAIKIIYSSLRHVL